MKFVFYGLMVVVAFVLGKILYVPLAPALLGGGGAEAAEVESIRTVTVRSPFGNVTEIVDLTNIDKEEYPEEVRLLQGVTVADQDGLNPLLLDANSPVRPLELQDMMLKVTSPLASHLTGEIPVLDTNFAEEVAKKRIAKLVAKAQAEKTDQPEPVKPKPSVPEVAKVEPAPPKPEPKEMVKPEPEPEPAPEPAPAAPTSLSNEQIIAAMKESLESKKITEIDATTVTNWEASEEETIEGEVFQIGVATYKENTILGPKSLRAKALFKEGELQKWVYANTGLEIR